MTKTRFPNLGYEKHAKDLWRIVDLESNNAPVGPLYRTRAELLADLERYGKEYNGE